MNHATRRGFTLVELLMVIVIMGIVTSLVTSALIGMLDHWRQVQAQTELGLRAEQLLERMREDVTSIITSSLTDERLRGAHQSFNAGSPYFADLSDDRLMIPVKIKNSSPQWLQYYVNRDGGHHVLMRNSWPLSAGATMPVGEANVGSTPQADGVQVLSLHIEYRARGESEWLNDVDWDRPDNPDSVRISIVLGHDIYKEIQVARKIVCPIL